MIKNHKLKFALFSIFGLLIIGLILPESPVVPVRGAGIKDWNPDTFWYEPWGKSGVHKGIDIFYQAGTPVISSSYGMVIYSGNIDRGGNIVLALGPKWRFHYYAHLKDINVGFGAFLRTGDVIGSVGNSGNARGKPPHLHYTLFTLIPYLWKWDTASQGWKKIFYLDPGKYLTNS